MAATEVLGILTIDSKGRVSFPQSMREALDLTEGAQLRVERDGTGHVALVPVETLPRDQLYFHTVPMRERITRAERSFTEGTATRTDGETETLAFLHSLKGDSLKGR